MGCGIRGFKLELAVELTVSVAVIADDPVTFIDGGETAQVNPTSGGPPQDRFTVPVNTPSGVIEIVEFADCPGVEMFMVDGFTDIEKS